MPVHWLAVRFKKNIWVASVKNPKGACSLPRYLVELAYLVNRALLVTLMLLVRLMLPVNLLVLAILEPPAVQTFRMLRHLLKERLI